MAFQEVPNTAEVVIVWLAQGVVFTNTFYGRFPTLYGQSDIDLLAEEMDGWVDDGLKTLVSGECTYVRTEVRGLALENDVFATNSTGTGAGQTGTASLPANVALCVSRRTGLTGRSARGRVYIGGMAQTVLDTTNENRFATTWTANVVTALNAARVRMANAGFTEVVVSRYASGAPRMQGVTFPVTEYVAVDRRVDSQRSRLPLN